MWSWSQRSFSSVCSLSHIHSGFAYLSVVTELSTIDEAA